MKKFRSLALSHAAGALWAFKKIFTEVENFKYLFLGLNDNGNIVGATMLIIQKYNGFVKAYAARGFLIDYDNLSLVETFTNELKKYLSKMQIIF